MEQPSGSCGYQRELAQIGMLNRYCICSFILCMSHLVEPLKKVTLQDCYISVQKAHDFLVERGKKAVAGLNQKSDKNWGVACKRVRVDLSAGVPSEYIGKGLTEHSLVEIINQCATIERLLDALKWAQTPKSGLSKYMVRCCHPTTSSADNENDLMLESENGKMACFEVSDVASGKDGNNKEKKSLVALGVLNGDKSGEKTNQGWPKARRAFLVVSEEFGKKLPERKRAWLKGDAPHCHYKKVGAEGTTVIFEVLNGGPDA